MAALSINQSHRAAPPLSPDPIENEVLKTWQVGTKSFRLLRIGDQLEGELILPLGKHVRIPIPFPPNLSIEEAILDLMSRTPVEYSDGLIDLEVPEESGEPPRAHEPGRPRIFRSLLDPETLIDDNCWAVTLVDTLPSQLFDPKTWGGHAAILIEGVEKGTFFLKKAHLISGFGYTGEISLTRVPIKHFEIGRIVHQSASWTLSPTRAQYMLDQIEKEEAEIRAGRLKITLDPFAKGDDPRVQNCFLWARDQLRRGGIELYRGNPEVLIDNSPRGIYFQVPSLYFPNQLISPKGIHSACSKAHATVRVESPYKRWHTIIDITETLATELGDVSWKIAKETGKGWSIIPDAKALLDCSPPVEGSDRKVEESDPKIVFRDPVVVSVQIVGKPGLRRIDVTETVKKGVAKALCLEKPECTML